jgi:hypothetical protein
LGNPNKETVESSHGNILVVWNNVKLNIKIAQREEE